MSTLTATTPAVWLGCYACYNAGDLTGRWFTIDEAADATADDVHGRSTTHEEFDVFDVEYVPSRTNLSDLRTWADAWERLGPEGWHAFLAFHLHEEGEPDVQRFEDAYQGQYESQQAFVEERLEADGTYERIGEWLAGYIDSAAIARDWFTSDFFAVWQNLPDEPGFYHVFAQLGA